MNRYDKALRLFIGDRHPMFRQPLPSGEWIYATDGIALCKVPLQAVEREYPPYAGNAPDMNYPFTLSERLQESESYDASKLLISDETLIAKLTEQVADCTSCFGDGQCDSCGCGSSHVCRKCDGVGSAVTPPEILITFGGASFNYSKVLVKALHAAIEISGGPFALIGKSDGQKPVLLQAGKAEIAVMPVSSSNLKTISLETAGEWNGLINGRRE